MKTYIYIVSGLAPTFGGKDIDPPVAIPAVASRIAKRRADDIENGLGLGRAQVTNAIIFCFRAVSSLL